MFQTLGELAKQSQESEMCFFEFEEKRIRLEHELKEEWRKREDHELRTQ